MWKWKRNRRRKFHHFNFNNLFLWLIICLFVTLKNILFFPFYSFHSKQKDVVPYLLCKKIVLFAVHFVIFVKPISVFFVCELFLLKIVWKWLGRANFFFFFYFISFSFSGIFQSKAKLAVLTKKKKNCEFESKKYVKFYNTVWRMGGEFSLSANTLHIWD